MTEMSLQARFLETDAEPVTTYWESTPSYTEKGFSLAVLSNNLFAVGVNDDTLQFWDFNAGTLVKSFDKEVSSTWTKLASLLNNIVAMTNYCSIYLWNFDNPAVETRLDIHTSHNGLSVVEDIMALPGGLLATVTTNSGVSKIGIWNENGIEMKSLETGHRINRLLVLPNGLLAVVTKESQIQLWDIASGVLVKSIDAHQNHMISIIALPNGMLACGFRDGTIQIWNVESGKLFRSFKEGPYALSVVQLFALPNGLIAGCTQNREMMIWEIESGTMLKKLITKSKDVIRPAFLHNGNLAAVSNDFIKSWSLFEYSLNGADTNQSQRISDHPVMRLLQNQLRVDEVPALFSKSLERLDVSHTCISDELIQAILKQCPRLKDIKYDGCGWLTDEGKRLIEERRRQANTTTTTSTSRTTTSQASSSSGTLRQTLEKQPRESFSGSSSSVAKTVVPKQTLAAAPDGLKLTKVLYDYTASHEFDLTIKEGDLVQVLDEDPHGWKESGWTYCKQGNIKGYITTTYLDLPSPAIPAVSVNALIAMPAAPSAVTSLAAVAAQAQQTTIHTEQLAKELRQHVDKVAETLSSQTAADYKSLLSDVRREMQKQLQENEQLRQQQEIEMDRVRRQVEKATGNARLELEARMAVLEETQNLLMQDYKTQQANLAEKEYIMNHQELARFYRVAQNKLQQMFLAYKVIESGLVVNTALTNTDKAIQVISLAGESIPLPGSQAVATWLGYAIQAGVWFANKQSGNNDKAKIAQMTELVVSFKELDELTETTSHTLALMYEEQLKHVTPDSAGILAEFAVKLIVAYLWAGEYQNQALNDQFVSSVARVCSQTKAQGFWQKLGQKFSELKGKFKDKDIATKQAGENWTAFGVFQRPGLKTSANPKEHYFSGSGTEPELYGYRLEKTEGEALAAGLVKTSERVPSHVLAAKLSRGDKTELSQVSKEARLVKDQAELNAMQLRIEKAKNDALVKDHAKLAEDMEEMKRQLAQLSRPVSMTSAPESIADIIFIMGCTLSVDRTKIAAGKLAKVNSILKASAANCSGENIKYNGSEQVTELTLPNLYLVKNLKVALVEALGL